jgi:hypothetical protein
VTPMPATDPEWDELKREFTAACAQSAQSARIQIAHELNQLFRRFRQYENEADWVRMVMEGAGAYARQAALFSVQGDSFTLRGAVNLNLAPALQLKAKAAASFDAVLRSKEAVTALRAPGEVGDDLSSAGKLAFLFPILNGSRVVAVLFAAAEEAEVDPLELVANMAASALERKSNAAIHAQILPVAPQPVADERRLPEWANVPADQRALHSQAARFARVTVAEMQLLKPTACRTALEKGDLYVILGKEIDKARDTYRKQFMTIPSMTDYFHRELVGSILGGDASKLGADYPGELD